MQLRSQATENKVVEPTIRFVRKRVVMHMTGLSSSGIYDLMNRNLFPKSIKLPGGKSVAWLESDILLWQKQVIAKAQSTTTEA